jgi:hypothetical protein
LAKNLGNQACRQPIFQPFRDVLLRAHIAEDWLANGIEPKEPERVARESLGISEIGPKPVMPPNQLSSPKLASHFILPIHRNTLGWALFQEGRYPEALAEFERRPRSR